MCSNLAQRFGGGEFERSRGVERLRRRGVELMQAKRAGGGWFVGFENGFPASGRVVVKKERSKLGVVRNVMRQGRVIGSQEFATW